MHILVVSWGEECRSVKLLWEEKVVHFLRAKLADVIKSDFAFFCNTEYLAHWGFRHVPTWRYLPLWHSCSSQFKNGFRLDFSGHIYVLPSVFSEHNAPLLFYRRAVSLSVLPVSLRELCFLLGGIIPVYWPVSYRVQVVSLAWNNQLNPSKEPV